MTGLKRLIYGMVSVNCVGGGKTKIAFRLRNKIISDVLSVSQKNRIHIGSGKISGCEFWFAGENNRMYHGKRKE